MIYFVQGIDGGPIKIGFTKSEDMTTRLRELQCGSPVKLKLIGTTVGGHAEERALHQRFAKYRLHGEWFKPCRELHDVVLGPIAPPSYVLRPLGSTEQVRGPLDEPTQRIVDVLRSRQDGWFSSRQVAAATGLSAPLVRARLRSLHLRGWTRARACSTSSPKQEWMEYRLLNGRRFGSREDDFRVGWVAGPVANGGFSR